jgi:acylphosphatase
LYISPRFNVINIMEKKAIFYVTGEVVQHAGCRLRITSALIHAGFKKGGAFNLPDGRVEVVLEGEEEQVKKVHRDISDNLVEWLIRDADDREGLKKRIGNPGIKVTPLEYNNDIIVLDIGLFSHSLTFDQIYKGVDVYKDLAHAISRLNETLKKRD